MVIFDVTGNYYPLDPVVSFGNAMLFLIQKHTGQVKQGR